MKKVQSRLKTTNFLLSTHKVSVIRQPRTFFDDVLKKYCSVLPLLNLKVHTKVHTKSEKSSGLHQ